MNNTVRDFKRIVLAEWSTLGEWEEGQKEFWYKLNRMGARNIMKFPPEKVPDIDAMVELSPVEWEALAQEFMSIKNSLVRIPAILGFPK